MSQFSNAMQERDNRGAPTIMFVRVRFLLLLQKSKLGISG